MVAMPKATRKEVYRIAKERAKQEKKWGPQRHPDGTSTLNTNLADMFRTRCQHAASTGLVSWLDILLEEVYEASAEVDLYKLREEVIQLSAVGTAWAEDLTERINKLEDEDPVTTEVSISMV